MRYNCFILLICSVIILASCAASDMPGTADSSTASSTEHIDIFVEENKTDPPKLENDEQQSNLSDNSDGHKTILTPDNRIVVYRFIPESELYDISKLLEIDSTSDYVDVFNYVCDEVFPNTEIPVINAITLSKSHIVCDFSEDWLNVFSKGQLYEFCNTLVMTLKQNGICESVSFQIDGKLGLLGEEVWQTAELKILESADASEFTKIREQIPYNGMQLHGGESYFDLAKSLKNDATALKIQRTLRFAGELTNEFDHPSDMDMQKAVQSLIWSTKPIYITPDNEYYDVEVTQKIMPIAASVSQRLAMQETCFWIKEHIEETAYRIFGNDTVIKHCEPSLPYQWFETEGVYTPPHMGGAGHIIPHLYSYTVDIDNETVNAEVAYLRYTMQGFYDAVLDKFTEDYDEVEDYLENRAQRHIVTLRTEPGGSFLIRQHHLSVPGGN